MRPFKFFEENVGTTYHGQMSLEALRFFRDCEEGINGRRYYIITELARYRLTRTDFRFGYLHGGLVEAYPREEPSTKILFTISDGEILSHEILIHDDSQPV